MQIQSCCALTGEGLREVPLKSARMLSHRNLFYRFLDVGGSQHVDSVEPASCSEVLALLAGHDLDCGPNPGVLLSFESCKLRT